MANLARNINTVSLDAVAVSLLWQFIFCVSFAERAPTIAESVSLGLTVWLIYCADRLLDAARIDTSIQATYRHQFHLRHRPRLTIIWMALLVADAIVVCFGIDGQILVLGIGLAAAVLIYGAGVHFAATPLRRIPKEVQVGFLFACGVSLVSWPTVLSDTTQQLPMLVTLGLASLLFACNCIFVAVCELETDQAQGFDSLPRRWMKRDCTSIGSALFTTTSVLAMASLILAWLGLMPWIAGVTLAISFAFLAAMSLAQFALQLSIDRYFGGNLTAGLVADSALFLPPLLCVPWLTFANH